MAKRIVKRNRKESKAKSSDLPKTADIIGRLLKRHMDDIVEDIFQYLDYHSLKSASVVCKSWNKTIFHSKNWQKLIERNVLHNPFWESMWNSLSVDELLIKLNQNTLGDAASDDDYPKFYRDLAHKIGCSVESIRNNWRTGKFLLSQLSLGNSDAVQIDKKKLVIHKCCGHVDIHFNMKERKDLLAPEMEIKSVRRLAAARGDGISPAFAFHRDTLVTGLNRGQLCFWDMANQARDPLPLLVMDIPELPQQSVIHGGNLRFRFEVSELKFSPSGRYLISATTVDDSDDLFDEQHLVNLWSVISHRPVIQLSHLQRISVRHHHGLSQFVGFDDDLVVLSVKPLRWAVPGTGRCFIEVRTVKPCSSDGSSLNLVRRIDGPVCLAAHYSRGILVTAGENAGRNITLRRVTAEGVNDVTTRIIPDCDSIHSIRLVGNEYIVSWHNSKDLMVWDLQAVLRCSSSAVLTECPSPFLIQNHKNPISSGDRDLLHYDRFEADEFGIALTIDCRSSNDVLPIEMYHQERLQTARRRFLYIIDFKAIITV